MPSGPPLVIANAAQVSLRWSSGTSPMVNVIGAQVGAGTAINQTLANALDTAIKSAFSTHLAALIHTTATLISVGVRDLRQANMVEYVGVGAGVAGTGTGDPLPRGTAFVVTIRTARSGQSYRGRVYLGGFAEGANDTAGQPSAAVGTGAANFVSAVATAFSSNGLTLAVLSRPAYATHSTRVTTTSTGTTITEERTTDARPGAVTPWSGIIARNLVWDSQRRRTSAGSTSTLFQPPVAMISAEDQQLLEVSRSRR